VANTDSSHFSSFLTIFRCLTNADLISDLGWVKLKKVFGQFLERLGKPVAYHSFLFFMKETVSQELFLGIELCWPGR
jgi:hypothetical protein